MGRCFTSIGTTSLNAANACGIMRGRNDRVYIRQATEEAAREALQLDLYERMKKDAPELLELGCDDFAAALVKDYGMKPHSTEFNSAIEIWKKKHGLSLSAAALS